MAICELLDLTDHIREMILDRRPISEVKRAAKEQGMRFLRESAVERVHARAHDAARDQQGDLRRMSVLDWLMTPPPDVAVEIDRAHVGAARLEWRGGRPIVAAHAVEPLPAGAVVAGAGGGEHARRGRGRAGGRARARPSSAGAAHRVALVVPDTVAKVSLLRLEKVPAKAADLREIVRWQVRKSAPFPIEQAVLSVSPGTPVAEGGREFIVALAREDVVRQYEQACAMAGAHAGIVDLATFGVLNSVLAGGGAPADDWLLVHRRRHLHHAGGGPRRACDLLPQPLRGVGRHAGRPDPPDAMYYEDRLKGTGIRAGLAGRHGVDGRTDAVRRDLEARLGASVERVDPRAAAGWSIASARRRSWTMRWRHSSAC